MPLSRRALLASLPAAAALLAAGPVAASRAEILRPAPVGRMPSSAGTAGWISGVCDDDPAAFGAWRGSPVAIVGMFGDATSEAQQQQFQFAHSTHSADVDLAVGGPIDDTWAQVAAGSQVDLWTQIAAVLRDNWHHRTVYLRYAHEANGTWMPWAVAASEVTAFKTAFRLFVTTMRRELSGHDVKFVFAPNFGSWSYSADSMFPGADVVDVIGVSMYEWTLYDTAAKWKASRRRPSGPPTGPLTPSATGGRWRSVSGAGARAPSSAR